jgi:16S rRNA (uracil1498-N3)-methyltransferase
MRRYYYSENLKLGDLVNLKGEIFHHIFDVCRQQSGHHFELMTSDGNAFLVQVVEIKKKESIVRVLEKRELSRPHKPFINLILSVPKIATFETILEKSVELGVTSIQPVISNYSFIKSVNHFPNEKRARWNKIILQATQQSARGNLLILNEVKDLSQILNKPPWREVTALGIFSYEGKCELSFKNYLQKIKKEAPIAIENLWALIGSEGGFSEQEVARLKQLDLQPVTLGDQVLRVETACQTIVSSLKYEFDLL